jgi:uncharacterized protein (DUF488 family)
MSIVYTIGHSAHPYDKFAGNLEQNKIEVLVDVRSSPYSKYCPQFDRELMSRNLQESGMKYLFLGSELGGRPEKAGYYDGQGRAVYGRMISDPLSFQELSGLSVVLRNSKSRSCAVKRIRHIVIAAFLLAEFLRKEDI